MVPRRKGQIFSLWAVGVDIKGKSHTNSILEKDIETPHVQSSFKVIDSNGKRELLIPGGVRFINQTELPKVKR